MERDRPDFDVYSKGTGEDIIQLHSMTHHNILDAHFVL